MTRFVPARPAILLGTLIVSLLSVSIPAVVMSGPAAASVDGRDARGGRGGEGDVRDVRQVRDVRALRAAQTAAVVPAPAPPADPVAPPEALRVPVTPALDDRAAVPVTEAFTGRASWYGPGFAGQRTASGESYDPAGMTAAHRSLPLGTEIRVTNLGNGHQVILRINDRGPYSGSRVLDVSSAAADALAMKGAGVVRVRVEVLG